MASEIIVRELRTDEHKLWDELVERSSSGTIFHQSVWLTTCEELLNKKLRIFGIFENSLLIGGCSFYSYKLFFFNIASSIIEMTPYGGLILSESQNKKVREQEAVFFNIMKSLLKALESEAFDKIIFINSPGIADIRPFTWNKWQSKIFYTYYLDLNNYNLSKDTRWTLNKALKNEIRIEKSVNIELFTELFKQTFLHQNINPPVSDNFLKKIYTILKNNNGELWIAKTKSEEIAASEIILYDNKRAYRWAAASHIELRKTGAPTLLLFEIFQILKKRGFREINLMAANTPQLAKFITGFNPRLIPYYGVSKQNLLFDIFSKFKYIYTIPRNKSK